MVIAPTGAADLLTARIMHRAGRTCLRVIPSRERNASVAPQAQLCINRSSIR
jgi:hypothetical protein